MRRSDFAKAGKFATLRRLVIFNFAAIIGFALGTVSFTLATFMYLGPTFAWLFANCVGGLSHFGFNWALQGQSKNEITRNFVVFNATGILSFLLASGMFAAAVLCISDSTVSWLLGSLVGTLSHFVLNERCMKIRFKR